MRKHRDFDAELKALTDKARQLKERKVQQFGDLVVATGADALPIQQLAELLLAGTESKDTGAKESWRKRRDYRVATPTPSFRVPEARRHRACDVRQPERSSGMRHAIVIRMDRDARSATRRRASGVSAVTP